MSMKNSNDTVVNRTRDLPPQPPGPFLDPVTADTQTALSYKDTTFKGCKIPTRGLMALVIRNVCKTATLKEEYVQIERKRRNKEVTENV